MINLQTIQEALTSALKAKDQLRVDTLRGLKTRIQNEQIAKMKELEDGDVLALIRSEVKRRKEAATAFDSGDRAEMATKERAEAEILAEFLPAQASEEEIQKAVDAVIADNGFVAAQFGQAMGKLKATLPNADGATLVKILKEKLTS